MSEDDVFTTNLKRWALFCPEMEEQIRNLRCKRTFFVRTETNEQSLAEKVGEETVYLHSMQDPVAEAKQQFDLLDLINVGTVYIHGVGAGFHYDAAYEWLRGNEERFLVFLENDLEIIYRLFETERGRKILSDKQVRLQYFSDANKSDKIWMKLCRSFASYDFRLIVTDFYRRRRPSIVDELHSKLAFWNNIFRAVLTEYRSLGTQFYANFYPNLLFLPESYRINNLFGQFRGVPAIICGAGPSLDKNLAFLETLSHKAIIFAGGTALNAVNSRGFVPHLGLGIDPNVDHQNRVIMNTAYELPFIWRSRIYNGVLHIVHGPKLYTTGSGGYETTDWYEQQLGIPGLKVQEGFNVVNFSLSLAYEMGCNPIIFVGLDLAYSDDRSYCSGVLSHPIHLRKKALRTKTSQEELIVKNDINGQPVHTLWKWVSESFWLGSFIHSHKHVLFINATEGGLGIPGVPNRTLEDVTVFLLQQPHDFRVRLHGEMQNSHMPPEVTKDNLIQLSNVFKSSLVKCLEYCKQLQEIMARLAQSIEEGKTAPEDILTPEAKEIQDLLVQEDGYKYFLNEFDEHNKIMQEITREQLKFDQALSPQDIKARTAKIEANRYGFLKRAIETNLEILETSALTSPQTTGEEIQDVTPPKEHAEGEQYSFDNYTLTIIDPELNLNIKETEPSVTINDVFELFYPSQIVKLQQYYLNKRLHGPVTYFSESGQILAQSWYVNGLQEGKSWFYYHTGQFYCLQRFRNGMQEGLQQYYYPTGILKASLNYKNGLLHGDVWLYYPNGKKFRELHFSEGKRNGVERMWNKYNLLTIEVEYKLDSPIGVARTWFDNGQLAREIVYDDFHQPASMRMWYADGKPYEEDFAVQDDYFDNVTKQTNALTKSLENVYEALHQMASSASAESHPLKKEFEELKHRVEHLVTLNDKLYFESGMHPGNPKEPVWKTPAHQREMQLHLGEISQKLKNDVDRMLIMIQKFGKQKTDEQDDGRRPAS